MEPTLVVRVPNGTEWSRMEPNGPFWSLMEPNGAKWTLLPRKETLGGRKLWEGGKMERPREKEERCKGRRKDGQMEREEED